MYGDGTVADRDYAGEGPLAGLLSGMRWAKNLGFPFLISAPLDCPFLPLDLIKRLNSVGAPSVSASSATRPHFVTGLWRTSDAKSLKRFLQSGQRSAQNWCQHCDANICEFDSFDEIDPFFNVNTLSDLETAGKLFGQLNHSSCKFI
jgi:molybdopterin-guanine dinucleotide biosynthesis protein A